MPEDLPKIPLSTSPVSRSGAGDISERELCRERYVLQTTPPARPSRLHRKQMSVPVNKFTGRLPPKSPNVQRIRSCLEELRRTPVRPARVQPKAVSMEDLTPTKRSRKDCNTEAVGRPLQGAIEEQAAARICRFMLLCVWRRRRHEVRCLRKTLEFQLGCSERLRIQVHALKSLLDADNGKVRLAMKELERLKQLLKDKDKEKAVLEREKIALEKDVSAAEDRASEMSIGWRNSRNEAEGLRAGAAAAAAAARAQRDLARERIAHLEEGISHREALLSSAQETVAALRQEAEEKQKQLDATAEQLRFEQEAREECSRECALLNVRVSLATDETSELKAAVGELSRQLARLDAELKLTREQLDWWPRPLTRMLGAARSWLRYPMSMPEAVLWSLAPARHGC